MLFLIYEVLGQHYKTPQEIYHQNELIGHYLLLKELIELELEIYLEAE
jgi:hypothetical protein